MVTDVALSVCMSVCVSVCWIQPWALQNGKRKSADTIGTVLVLWPFPMLKYKYIFQIKYAEAILSNSTRKLLWCEITKMLIAVFNKNYCVIYYNIWHIFVPCGWTDRGAIWDIWIQVGPKYHVFRWRLGSHRVRGNFGGTFPGQLLSIGNIWRVVDVVNLIW